MAGGGEVDDEVPGRRRGRCSGEGELERMDGRGRGVVAVPDDATVGWEAAFGGEEVWLETGGGCGEREKMTRRSDSGGALAMEVDRGPCDLRGFIVGDGTRYDANYQHIWLKNGDFR
ncbi:hypothetical protein GUJ93_ZPchr0283g7106 [Zizania palustris]|uniref:Uncharacterized protein n=1 Tax=Zizania palustris TaxID=103762 RepID=A0A8J5TEC0_ZIZPA|nr:hypothetical protein GUJ93_ZPchr0283g7106 [Zizania palustris]